MILRGEFERNFSNLIDPDTKRLRIAPNVLNALLCVDRYEHGSRSMSAMLAMSGLSGTKVFNISALPSQRLWSLHVSQDFPEHLNKPGLSTELSRALAIAAHKGYCEEHAKTEPRHPDIVAWEKLDPRQQLDNLDPVPRRLLALLGLGYRVVPLTMNADCPTDQFGEIVESMIGPEHLIWLSRRLVEGWEHAEETQRWLRRNSDVLAFDKLPKPQKDLNRAIVLATLRELEPAGYKLVLASPGQGVSTS